MGYENGKIYKLWSVEGDDIYIGSTTNTLTKRLNQHKTKSKHKKVSSYHLFEKYDNVQIELIENFSCKDKNELTAREGYFIRNNTCVNKVIPNRTNQEYYSDNREQILEKRKEYRNDNKEKISEQDKKYYENNKEKLLEKNKDYYRDNKEKLKVKIHCESCNCEMTKKHLSRHIQTEKHKKNITLL